MDNEFHIEKKPEILFLCYIILKYPNIMITHVRFFNLQGFKYVNVSFSHNYRLYKICKVFFF